jgi:hypothetical protein
MDLQFIDFDTVYGSLSAECNDLLEIALKESLKGFLASIKVGILVKSRSYSGL